MWRQLGLPRDGVTVLNTGGAFGAAKIWPAEHFARLAQTLVDQHGMHVLINCGPKERCTRCCLSKVTNTLKRCLFSSMPNKKHNSDCKRERGDADLQRLRNVLVVNAGLPAVHEANVPPGTSSLHARPVGRTGRRCRGNQVGGNTKHRGLGGKAASVAGGGEGGSGGKV